MSGRSLRPRGTVDYRASKSTSATPGWLKKGSEKVTHKENKEPKVNKASHVRENPKRHAATSTPQKDVPDPQKRKKDQIGVKGSGTNAEEGIDGEEQLPQAKQDASQGNSGKTTSGHRHTAKNQTAEQAKIPSSTKQKTRSSKRVKAASDQGKDSDLPVEPNKPDNKASEEVPKAKKARIAGAKKASAKEDADKSVDGDIAPKEGDAEENLHADKNYTELEQADLDRPETGIANEAHKENAKASNTATLKDTVELARQVQQSHAPSETESSLAEHRANFLDLQEKYAALHGKYQDVKAQRIQEVEGVMMEIKAQEHSHTQKALQLAAHWESEAQRQAAIAQHGDVAALERRLQDQDAQLQDTQELLLEAQTQVLEKEEENNELKRKLGELVRLVEHLEAAQENISAEDQQGDGDAGQPEDLREPSAAEMPVIGGENMAAGKEVRANSQVSVQEAQQNLSHAKLLPTSSQVLRGMSVKQAVQAGNFEIRSLSSGTPAACIALTPGDENAASTVPYKDGFRIRPAGSTIANIVPYGASATQVAGKSRFALEAEANAETQKHDNVAQDLAKSSNPKAVTQTESRPQAFAEVHDAILQLGMDYQGKDSCAAEKVGSIPGSPAVGRQLSFTPGKGHALTAAKSLPEAERPKSAMRSSQVVDIREAGPLEDKQSPTQHNFQAKSQATDAAISAGAMSDVTNKGLINLVGLTIDAPRPRGGFSYTHPATGFVFEIVHDESESEDEEGSLVFNPLDFGSAEELLPSYLKYEIKFAPEMRLKLVSRIMEHLGRTSAAM